MADMRKVAGELLRCAHEMETSGEPRKWVQRAKDVMDKNGVRQALNNPPANMGTCNKGRRVADELHKVIGTFNANPLTIGKVAGVMRDVAGECSKW